MLLFFHCRSLTLISDSQAQSHGPYLNHPHIIKPRAYGHLEDGRVWCALEYVDGWTLGEWKERTFPTFREIARVAAQIAGAIEYMHAHPLKFRHRDLKLSNVMIRRSNGEPVIIDLGCATYENAEELTTTPLPPGTDRYLTLGAPVTGVMDGASKGEVPAGSLLHGTAYKTDALPGAPLGELRVIYDHVEIPGKGKFPVCVVSGASAIRELKDDKATAQANVNARPVTSWAPPRD